MSMDSGMRRQAWNGIVDLIFCAILVVLSFLGMMKEFMQLRPDGPWKYMDSIREIAEEDGANISDDAGLNKVKATLAGLALTIIFAGITALLTILAYPCPYDKMRCPVNFFPYMFFISSIITIVASVLTYIHVADKVDDEGSSAEIKPYIGFICCLLSGVMAIMFLCIRSCYKPVPKDGSSQNHQPLNNGDGYDNNHTSHTRV